MGSPDLETAWQELAAQLARYVRSRIPDPYDAEDILQEVFCRAYEHLGDLRDPGRLSAWIYRIARHAVVDYHRRRRPQGRWVRRETSVPVLAAEAETPPGQTEAEVAACLGALLEQLPDSDRQALNLTVREGLKQKELAARLGLSISSAKSRVQRARSRLRALFLACCEVEFDRRGNLLDFRVREESKGSRCVCAIRAASRAADSRH
ncbi:MAG: RNA polymerase sigma factor SigZ [Moorellales bacterium]